MRWAFELPNELSLKSLILHLEIFKGRDLKTLISFNVWDLNSLNSSMAESWNHLLLHWQSCIPWILKGLRAAWTYFFFAKELQTLNSSLTESWVQLCLHCQRAVRTDFFIDWELKTYFFNDRELKALKSSMTESWKHLVLQLQSCKHWFPHRQRAECTYFFNARGLKTLRSSMTVSNLCTQCSWKALATILIEQQWTWTWYRTMLNKEQYQR